MARVTASSQKAPVAWLPRFLVITGALQVGKTTTVESIWRIVVAQGVVLAASSRKGEGSAK